jgi:predicted ATPase
MDTELERFSHLLNDIKISKVNILTGNNGTGKSRFFAAATEKAVENEFSLKGKFNQVLCLSGTHNDKFPRKIWQSGNDKSSICYLGYKVANNMISDIAPFRVIVDALLGKNITQQRYPEAIDFCLERLNIDAEIKLHFRYGKNRKASLSKFVANEMPLNLRAFQDDVDSLAIASALREKDLSLQTISIKRGGRYYTLSDLSSGERAYKVALLGALYCTKRDALIFFDEPENSLHPAWQKSILKDFRKTLELSSIKATILVATHSPLIAGSISNQDAFTCNFPSGQKWQPSDLYGKTTDSTLKDQFNLYSSRSTVVIELTQKCLSYVTKGNLASSELYETIDALLSLGLNPEPGDPMRKILHTLEYLREHHELP